MGGSGAALPWPRRSGSQPGGRHGLGEVTGPLVAERRGLPKTEFGAEDAEMLKKLEGSAFSRVTE